MKNHELLPYVAPSITLDVGGPDDLPLMSIGEDEQSTASTITDPIVFGEEANIYKQ